MIGLYSSLFITQQTLKVDGEKIF